MRPLSAVLIASALAAVLAGQASGASERPRTAATYVADCNSADEQREETCVATFTAAVFDNRSGPGSLCNPDVGDDKVYQQALKTADWLRMHPENLKLDEFAGVRLAQQSLWACKAST